MTLLTPDINRFAVYRHAAEEAIRYGKPQRAKYYLANLALEEQKHYVEKGNEPIESEISDIEFQLDLAAKDCDGRDDLMALRARLLKAWVRPIIWAEVINLDGLSDAHATNVARNIQLVQAGDDTAALVKETLEAHDELTGIPFDDRSDAAHTRNRELNGFLHEAAPIQLAVRHNTAKSFILPSLAFDDELHPDMSHRIDGFYMDNRRKRSDLTSQGYQAGQRTDHLHVSTLIPIINARLTGNMRNSSRWPNDSRDFPTSRRLVTERRTNRLSRAASRTLDSISSAVVNTITRNPQQ